MLREYCYDGLRAGVRSGIIGIGIGAASVTEIDRINVLRANLLAMRRAVAALEARTGRRPDLALVDGNVAPALPCAVRTIVKGDSLSLSIAAASVVAKVTRDRVMRALARRYPGYGWEANAGYPTAAHVEAIRRLGVTPHHRRSFAPIRAGAFAARGSAGAARSRPSRVLGEQRACGNAHGLTQRRTPLTVRPSGRVHASGRAAAGEDWTLRRPVPDRPAQRAAALPDARDKGNRK